MYILKIAILGNGPSRKLFDKQDSSKYDAVIGCNYVHVDVDYTVIVDAYAARRLRFKQDKHHLLGRTRLVLGERCVLNLEAVKDVPAGSRSMADMLAQDGFLEDIIQYPDRFKGEDDSQRFLSSGHAAFLWTKEQFPNSEFDFFGFDSLFTGDEAASHTRKEMGDLYAKERNTTRTKPTGCVAVWAEYWEELFNDEDYSKAVFHGYEGDGWFLEKDIDRIERCLHPGSASLDG